MTDRLDSLRGQTILVVEDEAIIALGLTTYLEELGALVDWSTGIDEALDAIDRLPAIDAAVVDLNLSGRMSTPILDRLAAAGVHTVLCTGYDEASVEERFRGLPRSEKPFTRSKIRRLITERPQAVRLA